MEKDRILQFLFHLRNSHHTIRDIYTSGSCFSLYLMLESLFPAAEAWYSQTEGHYITYCHTAFWDIGGEISPEYIEDKGYQRITNEIQLESSRLHKYGDQSGVPY